MQRVGFLLLVVFLACSLALQADTIKLKNGRVIEGRVVRFSNAEFVVLVPGGDAPEGRPDRMIILVDSVESIEFDTTGGTATAGPAEELVVLDGSQEVVGTGIQLQRGDTLHIRASGEMQLSNGAVTTPAGVETSDPLLPFPGERLGVLVALVGDPQSPIYHVIGEQAQFEARQDGELYLQINAGSLGGARGAYTARIQTPESTTARTAASQESSFQFASRDLRRTVEVPADQEWVDTGLHLHEGDVLRISATGTIHYTSSKTCGPDGGERDWKDFLRPLPVNDVGRGALIGKMGEEGVVQAFFVGENAEFTAERAGRLFLGINDDNYQNNSGRFQATVEIVPQP